jgi:hypothetical protein
MPSESVQAAPKIQPASPAMCRQMEHLWKAGFCGCSRLIFGCTLCPTIRPHTQEQHDAAIAARQARDPLGVETERRPCPGRTRGSMGLVHAGDGYAWRCRSCAFEEKFEELVAKERGE